MSEATAIGWVPRDDTLGARLALVRQRMGWNVKEAATECDITVQSWRNWEEGGHCRDQEATARKISRRTGASFLWVFAGVVDTGPTPDGSQSPAPQTSNHGRHSRGEHGGLTPPSEVTELFPRRSA